MTRGTAVTLAVALLAAWLPSGAGAADVPYTLLLDNRPVLPGAAKDAALLRSGVVCIEVTVATKIFSGLLTFGDSGTTARLSVRAKTIVFHAGSRFATVDGAPRRLPLPPFRIDGAMYVPLSTVTSVTGAKLSIAKARRTATIVVPAFGAMPVPSPAPAHPGGSNGLQLASNLTLVPSARVDAEGVLHVDLRITNTSSQSLTLEFPNSGRAAFLVTRDGTLVWDSTHGMMFSMIVGFETLGPGKSTTFEDQWADFGKQPPGKYELRGRLMTRSPISSSAVPIAAPPSEPAKP